MKKILPILFIFIVNLTKGQTLVVGAGASLYTTGGALVTLEDINFQVDGDFNRGIYSDVTTLYQNTFRFTGNTTTNISTTPSGAVNFYRLEIAKTGGHLRSSCSIQVLSTVSFISGLFDLNNNYLHLSNDHWNGYPSSIIGESETSRFIGGLIGGGFWDLPPNTPMNLANLGLEITLLSPDCRGVRILRGHTPQTSIPGVGTSISRYYDIIFSGGACGNVNAFNATVRLNYFDAEVNGLNENNLVLWKSLDTTGIFYSGYLDSNWANLNYSSRNVINNYIDQTAFIESDGNPPGTFPWISRFTLSTSNSARPFASAPQQIKTIAVPGKETITNKWKTWPNPADKILCIDITSTSASQATTSIFDSKGSLIRTQTNHLMEGSNRLRMDLKNLAAGIYYITTTWNAGKEKRSTKFVKL